LPEGTVEITSGTCHWARPGWTYRCTQDPKDPLGPKQAYASGLDTQANAHDVGA